MKVPPLPPWVKCSPSHKSVGLTELGAFVLLLKVFQCLLALEFPPALLRVEWSRWRWGGESHPCYRKASTGAHTAFS